MTLRRRIAAAISKDAGDDRHAPMKMTRASAVMPAT